jgi:hypothetical protein
MSTLIKDIQGLVQVPQLRKRGQMNRIGGAIVLGFLLLAASSTAWAQELTTGRVTGRVTDTDTGAPMGGVTVIAQGPQGEDATLTDDTGHYQFSGLSVGTYVLRFYAANNPTQVEQPGVTVAADKMVRVNVKIASSAQAATQQTYVITGQAPVIDIGSARLATTFFPEFTLNVPVEPNLGDVISKAPGAFIDGSGNVSIGGATGLENIYVVNSLNVTGLRYGSINTHQPSSIGGGTNLPTEFFQQIDVNAGGYSAEFGGAMGGVINTVLKSGSNEFHGSAFASWAPYWLTASPKVITTIGSSIAGVRKPDFDDRIGVEVGGPIIKDKLFFWIGFAPELNATHAFRYAYALPDNGMGMADTTKQGTFLPGDTQRANETRRTYSYAATINYIPQANHKLELSIFGTPNFNNQVRNAQGLEYDAAFPTNGSTTWAQESLTKTNTDIAAHWTSKLFDRRWQIEAIAGLHSEYFYDRSPSAALNGENQIQYWGSDLGTLEHLPGCENTAGFAPCPVNPYYQTGGFGQITKYTGNRWTGELKSTHQIELLGHNELKYGWHIDLSTFDLDRNYSGATGSHGVVWFTPDMNAPSGYDVNTQNYFKLKPNQYPTDFTQTAAQGGRYPQSDLVNPAAGGDYVDQLHAAVKSLSNALYLQDAYSPSALRNLTVTAGVRYEFQTIYDSSGAAFLSARNLGPRLSAVYDPFNDGRSKVSVGYGRFYEAVPLDVAARYFGGENFVGRQGIPLDSCANPNPFTWTGANEWKGCQLPAVNTFGGDAAGGYNVVNNAALPQTHIQGQYHNEIVATLERQLMDDLTARIDYTHRWLGTIIEDGYGDPTLQDVLANPGHVPPEAITDAKNDAAAAQKEADDLAAMAAANPKDADLASKAANAASKAGSAAAKSSALQTLATAPKPERTYDALTLSINKRFSKNWLLRASYTYSRLVGNYEGLYQNEQNYVAPNGNNAYDTPDLYVNSRGRLPNDHPHQGKVDGFWSHAVGPGKVTLGLSFSARSGTPKNYMTNLIPGANYQVVFLLPRGDAGRTPAVWQLDGHIAYSQKVQKNVTLEAYIDLFNLFDQQSVVQTDDNYSFDAVAPIQNGTAKDLAFAKNAFGAPINKNANFGQAIAYQAPFYSRLGLRLMF